jgi:NAD(P)-dependent dehydrogenase (short-subunit alcohol dehydrogenase family)
MLPAGTGSIINIGSVAGLRGGISAHIYSASKGAVQALTRSTAAELGETAIRVNCISPGAIVTGIFGKNAGLEGSKADRVTGVIRSASPRSSLYRERGFRTTSPKRRFFSPATGLGFSLGKIS